MVNILNSVLARIIETLLHPFGNLNSWAAMALVSLLTAILMLLAYRLISNQEKIRAAKSRIVAHLLEVRLYKDSLPVSLRAQGNMLWYNLKYLGQSLRPMLVLILPMVLVLIHVDQWFGYEPLRVGESTLLKVKFREGHRPSGEPLEIYPSAAFTVETPPLRMEPEGEVVWRLRANEPGKRSLVIRAGHHQIEKHLVVGENVFAKISSVRAGGSWLNRLANPGEPAIPEDTSIMAVSTEYPSRPMSVFGWHLHWLVVYFVLSVVFAFALKGIFKVEI